MKTTKAAMLFFAAAVLATLFALDVSGQGMSPVNPKFIEWQKRRAAQTAEAVGKDNGAQTSTNAQRRASVRRSAAAADGGGEEEVGFGLIPTVMDMDYLADINAGVVRAPVGGFPSSYDLRAQNRLSPVRDQGDYGTCWAFAAMGSLESGVLGKEGTADDFSENNLANLHGWDYDGFLIGGNALMATAYFAKWCGPVAESSDAYPNPGGSPTLAPIRHVQRVVWVPGKSDSLDNDAIKEAVMGHGALYASYYHASSYYKSSTASYCYPGGHSDNHAVAIVGWDDDYPASNFKIKPSGNGAYLVRNSWGAEWGDSGYYWVSYYDGTFARSTMYSFRNAEDTGNYGKIYQHDPLGMVNAFPRNWGANVFTATGADEIAAVGFYALTPKTSYSLSIYTGCQSGRPASGTCALTQSGTIDEPGYVTVPLSKSVSVTSGSRFSVVLKLTTPGFSYPQAIEYASTGISSGATASSGQSYYSSNGSSWTDLTQWNGTANFCIKAYAAAAVVTPDLASVSVSGPATVESGKTAKFTATARYTDNSEKAIHAHWLIADGSDYAAITSDGTLTAAETVVDRQVVIRAAYGENGIEKTCDWSLVVTAGPPPAPTGLVATQGTEARAIRLSWSAASGADAYAVYRSATDSSANAVYLGVAEAAKYSDTAAVPGKDYWYFVKARNSSGTSPLSSGASGWRALSAPVNFTAADGTSFDGVSVSWEAVEGASFHRVFRADSFDADPEPISDWIDGTAFFDDTAEPGVVHWYSVAAAVDSMGSRPSERSIPDDGFRAAPVVPASLSIEGRASVESGGVSDYSAYVLFSNGTIGSSPVSPTWRVSKGSVSRLGAMTAPVVTTNEEITLSANTTIEGVAVSGTKTILVKAVVPVAPTGVVAVAPSPSQGVTVTWNAVDGASSYRVYRSMAGQEGLSPIGSVSETSFMDTSATPGIEYAYCVSAVNGAGEGETSASATAAVPLAAPAGVTATKDRTNCVHLAWNAVPGATHYRVARATAAEGDKTPIGEWTASQAYDDVPPSSGTAYFYFVQAATDSVGANAGDWSASAEGLMKTPRILVALSISGPDRVPSSGEAVYSCTAIYSDDTEVSVRPAWSAVGSAAIDADGCLTALAVSADEEATVAAFFQGKRTTKAVAIVAPAAATATVTAVSAAQRWPFSGLVDIDYTLETAPAGTRATVSVSANDRDHNRALAATSLSGDGAEGPVAAGEHRLTWNLAADHPGFHAKALDVSLEAVPYLIVAPTGITASMGTSTRGIDLWWDAVANATGYEIWRANGSMSSADAARAATVSGATAHEDTAVVPGAIYFYWLKTVTPYGTSDFSSPVFGYRARVSVTVAFDGNGGTPSSSISGIAGDAYGTLPSATREGYAFDGWFTAAEGGVQVTATSLFDENVTTLYAHWTANTYAIAFDMRGGRNGTESVTATYGAAMPPITIPTRMGYAFGGYWTATNGVGTQYYTAAGVSAHAWNQTADATLYAQWTVNSYTVTFDANGGEGGTSASLEYGSALTAPAVTKTGHTFAGWLPEVPATVPAGDATYVAQWTVNSYTVAFDANGGEGGTSASLEYGSALIAPTVAKTGHTFAGWQPEVPATVPAGDATYVAQWTVNSYTVAFDANGGEGGTSASLEYGSALIAPAVAKTGHTFAGWQPEVPATVPAGDATYVAQWTVNSYTVTLNRQSGTGGSSSVTATYGAAMPAITVPKRTGYTFGGYWTATNGVGTQYYTAAGVSAHAWNQTADATLYAQWTVNSYTVTFDMQGGTNGTENVTATFGSAMPTIMVPTRRGYTFGGYWTEANGGGTQYYTASGASVRAWDSPATTTLYAKWTAPYKVQLWAGGPYWATTNIGAENPEDYGLYFWWGDTVGYRRDNDTWVASDGASSNFSFDTANTPTYGKNDATLQSEGWVTADSILAPEHDAAHVHWGDKWRMPRDAELSALCNNCDWTWTTTNGVNGYVVRGRGDYADASIFLPAVGSGYKTSLYNAGSIGRFWSSVPGSWESEYSLYLFFDSENQMMYDYYYRYNRSYGQAIRPVQDAPSVTVTFDGNGGAPSVASASFAIGGTYGTLPTAMRTGYDFAGWFTAASDGTQVTESSVADENVTTLYAKWTVSTYAIAFDANGGEGGTTVTLDYGSALTAPAVTRTGYTFAGWMPKVPATVPASDATYVAQWTVNTYTVTFDANGGEGGTSASLEYGLALAAPTVTKTGYTFAGWVPEVPATVSASNVTYVAQWTVNTYEVTFDRQGGTNGTESVTTTYGAAMPAITPPTRRGYTFCGYWTESNGRGTQYYTASGASARAWDKTAATTLYAKWTAPDKVQLWAGGPYWATTNIGAEKPEDYGLYFWWGDTVGYRRENDAWVASDGSSANFSFLGANTPSIGKDAATLQSEGWITADGVLAPEHDAAHVHWGSKWRMPTLAELSALCDNCDWTWTTQNGVSGYAVSGRGDYASASIFLPASGYVNGTSIFSADSDGYYWSSIPLSDSNFSCYLYFYSGIRFMSNYFRNYGLPVRPVQGTYVTVTFDANGGEGGTTVTLGYGAELAAPTVTKTGYTFAGWMPKVPATVPASDATYVAQWTVNTYTVTFDANGGEGGTSASLEYGSALAAPTVTKTGYTFAGWVPEVPATVPASNVTYVAQWVADDWPLYGVTFEDAVNSTKGSMNDFAYAIDMPVAGSSYNGIEAGEPYGWFAGSADDMSSIVERSDAAGGQCLKLQTEGGTLTNKLRAATANALRAAAEEADGAYFEADVKFVASDTVECGFNGGQGTPMFGLYAYAPDGGDTTNLVVFHACYDAGGGGVSYTNEVLGISIDTESFTRIRVEMKRMDGLNLFAVSIDGTTVTSSSACEDGRWFLAADSAALGTGRSAAGRSAALNRANGILIILPASLIAFSNYDTILFKGTGEIDNISIGTIGDTTNTVMPDREKVQLWAGGPYWATTNIGAEEPEDYGLYFWWGDTIGYRRENDAWVASDGSSANFSFITNNTPTYGKNDATLQSEGWITTDGVLAPAHDAAQMHWGDKWRMPRGAELSALCDNCDWTWTTQNGVSGFIVSGKGDYTSASIFLPAAGYINGTSLFCAGSDGYYWSSVPLSDSNFSCYFYFYSGIHFVSNYFRNYGLPVRPVQGFAE